MALGNVHLTPQLIQAVRDSVDILDVAASITRIEKRGNRYWGLCPFHKEKTPSFSLDPTRGLFYCFGCGVGGDAIRLHMQSSGDDFPAAIEALARANGIPLPAMVHAGRSGPDPEEILGAAADLYQAELARSRQATEYLDQRRVPEAVVKRFRLGYAPDRFDFLTGALRSRFRAQDLEAAGLIASKEDKSHSWDRFRDRLMFPIFGVSGRIVGFGGRLLGADPKAAKYLNTPETERFQKRNLLYGLHLARSGASRNTSRTSARDAAEVYWMPMPTASAPRSRPLRMPAVMASSCASSAATMAACDVAAGSQAGASPITAIRTGMWPMLAP